MYEENINYFWNLSLNPMFQFEKNIFDCLVHIYFYKNNRAIFSFMTKGRELQFAEFRRVKITPEFVSKCGIYVPNLSSKGRQNTTVVIKTSNFDKEKLINFLLSAKGGDEPLNEAFDKFICLWL